MKRYILILLSITGFVSCNNFLDEMPDNQIRIDTPEKVKRVLANAYPEASPALIGELSSDNIDDNGEDNPYFSFFVKEIAYWERIQEYSESKRDGIAKIWEAHYQAIAHANEALQAIEQLGNPTSLNPAKGEALVARAYAHFILVNLFCNHYNTQTSSSDLGIPYAVKTEKSLFPLYNRGTVAEVYQKIDADLQQGLPLIDDRFYSTPKFHFNTKAAYAFAARFYLYYEKWQEALKCANKVLGKNRSETKNLVRDWSFFADVNRVKAKSIVAFSQGYVSDIDANLMLQPVLSTITSIIGTGSERFSHGNRNSDRETLAVNNVWGRSDNYNQYWFSPFQSSSNFRNNVCFAKFPTYKSSSYQTVMVPFTADETLLVRAEAKIMLQDYAGGVDDINIWTEKFIVNTASPTEGFSTTQQNIIDFYNKLDYSTNSRATQKKTLHPKFNIVQDGIQENLLHYVLQCRRVLTLGEGLRWFDIRRYGIEVSRYVHEARDRTLVTVKDELKENDLRRTIQLPNEVIGAGLPANPR